MKEIEVKRRAKSDSQPTKTDEVKDILEKELPSNFSSLDHRKIEPLKWEWVFKDIHMINAKGEELISKTFFKPYFNKRCVVVVEGAYEWNKQKQPYVYKPGKDTGIGFSIQKKPHLLLAGLFNDNGHVVILTNYARQYVNNIHHRMPFLLTEDEIDDWINPELSIHSVMPKVLKEDAPKWNSLKVYRVPDLVSKLKNKGSSNILSIEEYQKK